MQKCACRSGFVCIRSLSSRSLNGREFPLRYLKKQVMDETFVSILTSNVLSLFTAILSIVVLEVYDSIAKKILTACIYSAVLMIAMLILLILKRIFALFIDNDKTI